MKNIFLHIGLHKTGTTTLQADVFPYLGFDYLGRYAESSVIGSHLYYDVVNFCLSDGSDNKKLGEVRSKLYKRLALGDLLISEEWLTSDYDLLKIKKGIAWQKRLLNLSHLVKGMPIKILITSREPSEAVFSLYCELLQNGLIRKSQPFFDFLVTDNSVLAYKKEYLEALVVSIFRVDPVFMGLSKIENGHASDFLSNFFGVVLSVDFSKKNSKIKSSVSVEVYEPSRFYSFLRRIWYIMPRFIKSVISKNTFNNIRNLLASDRRKFLIPKPDEEELLFAKKLLGEGE